MNNIIQTIRHTARAATVLLLALLAAQTAWANDAVTYIDMDGKTKTVTEYTEVTTDMTANGNGNIYWSSGTYVVKSSVRLNGCIRYSGAVIDLIVCDGAKLTVTGNDDGAFDVSTLNIYAQSNGTGMGVVNVNKHTKCIQLNIAGGKVTLDADGKSNGLYVFDGSACGLTVNGGDVTIQNSNGYQGAIYFAGRGFVTLNGGKLTVTNSYETNNTAIEGRGYNTINFNGGTAEINGRIELINNINLNSGNVTVNGEIESYGYTVTYDFTRATDSYYIKAFSNDPYLSATRTVQVKDGAAFLCNGNKYIGPLTLTDDDIAAISDQTMTPDISNHFSVNDAGTEYTIHTATGWGYFCDMLEAGETFSGKTVKLDANITVSRMAGGQPFTGTFDGDSHTLTLDYGTADAPVDAQFVAPFVETASGTSPVFRNLTISGTIYDGYTGSEAHNVGGLIGHLYGTVTIEHCTSLVEIHAKVGAGGFVGLCEHSVSFTDCHSSAVVHSADGSNSGFVAWSRSSSWEINFTGCLFDGKLLQQNGTGHSNGGFIGWKGDAKTVNITNCLCAPATLADGETMATDGSATFSREHSNYPATITNSYYTQTLGAAQGKQARAVTAGTDVTVAHAGVATHYATSGITAYKATGASTDSDPFIAGLLYNNNAVDVLYAGIDEVVSLTLSNTSTGAPDGYSFDGYTVSAGTLEGSTLTMPNQDVTVSAALVVIDWATANNGDATDPYMIYNKDQLDLLAHRVNGTHGETADGYSGKYFKLAKDISYSHTSDWDAFDSDESNYEAIGFYDGTNDRYFCGDFDGGGHTISGIRIYKGGSDYADKYQGLFGQTGAGANIHDVTLADIRITGYDNTGGIVGYNGGGTVSDCHVAADVAVCAVQSFAYYHGGIVGLNLTGTIEQCTSAATLTTVPATSTQYYGGIAGYNSSRGTLRDNLAIGATVPATKGNTYGAITGYNGRTLLRNYYANCEVANTPNATGVGCNNADVNNDKNPNGAVSIHTLTLADGITTTTCATVTIGTTGYYAQGTAIALSYSGTPGEGYQLGVVRNDGNGFTAAVADGDGNYTAVMPAANATAKVTVTPWDGDGTEGSPYIIEYASQLDLLAHRVNGTHGETAVEDGYSGKYFKLGKDISYPHKADGEEGADTESNYEAIGGNSRSFRGHFDGNNKTISGIRIHKDGSGYVDYYQGIFGLTGTVADIHDITLADARITGFNFTGGIVGRNDGTVTGCHVAADVAVCAVKYNASYHGGIVGRNNGTIEQCTSAVTLTISDADYSGFYGGIAGYNNGGTLSDNLAIGATVPALSDNSYGAITGKNNNGTLQCNYYTACKVAGVENATGVGCNNADVNNDNNPDGAVCINTLDLTARQAPDGNYWTTYYNSFLGFTIDADENACAYTATYGGSQLTLHKLGKEIPAGTAVIIVADNSEVSMTAATTLDDFTDDNDLRGVDVDTQTSALGTGTFYVLGMTTVGGEQHFGFHRYTGSTMAAHKAYVFVASSNSQAPARSLTMVFDDATAIESAEADSSLFTLHSSLSTWFTLDGRRLQAKPTAPGIYINNGKKVVIK